MRKRVANRHAIRAILDANPELVGSRVCIAAGMSHAQLSNVMAGRRPLAEDRIESLANALGVSVDAISYETCTCACGVAS